MTNRLIEFKNVHPLFPDDRIFIATDKIIDVALSTEVREVGVNCIGRTSLNITVDKPAVLYNDIRLAFRGLERQVIDCNDYRTNLEVVK